MKTAKDEAQKEAKKYRDDREREYQEQVAKV